MEKIGLVYSTFSNLDDAKGILKQLIDLQFVTCGNISAPHLAIYPWKEEICEEEEVAVLFKMPSNKVVEMMGKLRDIHPYDLPAIIQIEAKSLPDYASWLSERQ